MIYPEHDYRKFVSVVSGQLFVGDCILHNNSMCSVTKVTAKFVTTDVFGRLPANETFLVETWK